MVRNHIHPMVGTLFEGSRTPLQLWFYAIFLFTTTRNGVAAKEIQRQLGVTYKCAWRMGHKIREHMALVDGDGTLMVKSRSMRRTLAAIALGVRAVRARPLSWAC